MGTVWGLNGSPVTEACDAFLIVTIHLYYSGGSGMAGKGTAHTHTRRHTHAHTRPRVAHAHAHTRVTCMGFTQLRVGIV